MKSELKFDSTHFRLAISILSLIISVFLLCAQSEKKSPDYYPTYGWNTTTPKQQVMDSEKLAELIETIYEKQYQVRSVVVIRNGYLVAEAYFHPFPKDTWHIIHSCTKSITSALIGIAIDKDHIESIDKPVQDFFPERTVANLADEKKAMTLSHLLTMSSGLRTEDCYLYNWKGLAKMTSSRDWVQYVLDLHMAEAPGDRFEYSNCVAYLLSAILQQTTNMDALN